MTFCGIRTLGILLSCLTAISMSTQMIVEANETKPLSRTYKTIGSTHLNLFLYGVQDPVTGPPKPAIVFFFGGGWRSGSPRQFEHHSRYLASRGMIGITAD